MTAIRQQDLHRHTTADWRRGFAALAAAAILAAASACGGEATGAAAPGEPWGSNFVMPADLAKELTGSEKPVVVCTAPAFLYRTARIPGAVLHGPASSPEVLNQLSTSLVIYCGCCPLSDCPNLRPAYSALKDLGLARVRVLLLPDSFRTDWIERGYPIEK
jgi:thiosulfate/3-mercaptopyruvate sulfurtransferase